MDFTYKILFDMFIENTSVSEKNYVHKVAEKYGVEYEDVPRLFSINPAGIYNQIKRRYKSSHYNKRMFLTKNSQWLDTTFSINSLNNQGSVPSTSKGRPKKSYEESADRSKRRKRSEINKNLSYLEVDIPKIMICNYKKNQEYKKAKILEAVEKADKSEIHRIYDAIFSPTKLNSFSPQEALAIFLDLGLSKAKYEKLNQHLNKKGLKNVFPSYCVITETKKDSVPDNWKATEISAECSLQDLLDHTTNRILQTKEPEEIDKLNSTNLVLYTKYGFDGSSGQNQYKQVFSANTTDISDSNLFITSLVPLRLNVAVNTEENATEVWKNPMPSSTRFCRPIKFKYVKETKELIQSEYSNLQQEINMLKETETIIHARNIKIKHKLFFTMVDGKVAQHASGTSATTRCVICSKTVKEFNSQYEKVPEHNAEFGLSPLHARIRFMEFLLKVAYEKSIGFERIKGDKAKLEIKEKEKKRIVQEFREKLGLIIDTPKQGFGNTNDGNTARRFFINADITADILNIKEEIIIRFKNILNMINCGLKLNPQKFGEYAKITLHLFKETYPDRDLTPTVHKILCHGEYIIGSHILPIGELSEEAQEANHKEYRRLRLSNTCKTSRERVNTDLFHIMLVSSDPLISSLRLQQKRKDIGEEWPEEIRNIFEF